tara:strand:- start:4742 stop:5446 length:705 start_codon:yes stop_codon:yes gene_type:complete
MIGILSYPRSGNHLVRYIIEYLSERPTLGCRGASGVVTSADIPLYRRPSVKLLNKTALKAASPISEKFHFSKYIPKTGIDRLIFIWRDPIECYISHDLGGGNSGLWEQKAWTPKYVQAIQLTSTDPSSRMHQNVLYYRAFEGPRLFVSYEELIFGNSASEITKISHFIGAPHDRLATFLADIPTFFEASLKSPVRAASSHSHPRFYASRLFPKNLTCLQQSFEPLLNVGATPCP